MCSGLVVQQQGGRSKGGRAVGAEVRWLETRLIGPWMAGLVAWRMRDEGGGRDRRD